MRYSSSNNNAKEHKEKRTQSVKRKLFTESEIEIITIDDLECSADCREDCETKRGDSLDDEYNPLTRRFYTLAALNRDLLNTGAFLSTSAMDFALNILRRMVTRNDIFIAHGYVATYINHDGGDSWRVLGRQFLNIQARYKREGVYLLPIFLGDIRNGHWMVIIVHISRNHIKAYIMDSWPRGYQEYRSAVRENLPRAVSDHRMLEWEEVECMEQTEVECGPRAIWNIAAFCSGWSCGKEIREIIRCMANLGGLHRENAAFSIRNEIKDWLNGSNDWLLENRIWSGSIN